MCVWELCNLLHVLLVYFFFIVYSHIQLQVKPVTSLSLLFKPQVILSTMPNLEMCKVSYMYSATG